MEKESSEGGDGDFATGGAAGDELVEEARLVAGCARQQPNLLLILVGMVTGEKIDK